MRYLSQGQRRCARLLLAGAALAMFVESRSANAALMGGPDMVAPPLSVNNENPQGVNPGGGVVNTHQQGFDEQQNVVLAADLEHDTGIIPAGTRVDSHMIFYNFADKTNDGTATGTASVLAWESNQSNLVFMVESSTNLDTGPWSPASPTSQWWISGMVWTNAQPSKEREFFRVKGREP